jgi:hypothetical protein
MGWGQGAKKMSEVMTTQKLLIVDANGKPRICLDTEYGIRLLGEDGRPKACLSLLTTGQPALMFFHGPMPRVDLRLDETGNPDLTLVGNRQLETTEVLIRAWDKEDQQNKKTKKKAHPTQAKGRA